METLQRIKEVVELLSTDAQKVFNKGNRSASIRARKYAQEIKNLCGELRKELLEEVKKHNGSDSDEN